MRYSPSQLWIVVFVATAFLATGCRASRQIRDPEYAAVLHAMARAPSTPPQDALPPVAPLLTGPQPVDAYISYALDQNPDVQAARQRVEVAANRVPQAASLQDPMLGVTAFPAPPQTAAGQQLAAVSASQQLPWFGKLNTRAAAAEAETNMARAQLAAAELEVIEQIKRTYYQLYYFQQAIRITEHDRELLVELTQIAEAKYRTGGVSQQDVLRAQVEISNLESELIQLRQQRESAQAAMAGLLHISPETPLQALEQLPAEQVPRSLDRLYEQAVTARPELHAQLAAVRRDLQNVDLARLNYFPDLTASVMWNDIADYGLAPMANGQDSVGVGISINVPLYRKRLDAGIRASEAQATATARQYDSLRDRTTAEVKNLYAQATSQYELIKLFRDDIIPKAEQTLQVSSSAYQTGNTDFLQLIDNWRQLLRFQITYRRLETQLQQTLASLERVVGGSLPLDDALAADLPLQPEQSHLRTPLPQATIP
ncbi:MAG: TolC family protein [Pirellulaceae bacterium]